MSPRILALAGFAFAIVTPLLAQTPAPDPTVEEANQRKARAEAREAEYKAEKAAAEARVAPLSQFAGSGENEIESGGGEMEAAYLAAVSMRDAAVAIDRRVTNYARAHRTLAEPAGRAGGRGAEPGPTRDPLETLRRLLADDEAAVGGDDDLDAAEPTAPHAQPGREEVRGPAPPLSAPAEIIVLTGSETLSFDAYASFLMETDGIIRASVRALRVQGPRCPGPQTSGTRGGRFLGAGTVATIGALAGLLQSDTHVYGFNQLGDDAMLVSALVAQRDGFYIRQDELVAAVPAAADPIQLKLAEIAICEASLSAALPGFTPAQATDAQKARAAEINRILTRIDSFNSRLTTPATDGRILLSLVLRQSALRSTSSPYVLRVRVNRAGGTLITRKNLWTALGAPAIVLSGGVIASYSLSDRRSGLILVGGTVICRTGLTGLRSAIALRHSDIVCSENPPQVAEDNAPSRRQTRSQLGYDDSVFRLTEPVGD